MNASKESCQRAVDAFGRLNALLRQSVKKSLSSVYEADRAEVMDFLDAAHRKLPTEKAFKAEASRRRKAKTAIKQAPTTKQGILRGKKKTPGKTGAAKRRTKQLV